MTRFRLLLWPLTLGLTLAALTLFLFRSSEAEAGAQIWGDPHVEEWGVVADTSGSMGPELGAFRDAWDQFRPPVPEPDAYRLVAYAGEAAYLGQAGNAADFSQLLEQLQAGEEGPCPTAALAGLAQLLRNSAESPLKSSQALLLTDGTPRARPQQIAFMVDLMLKRGIRLNTILSGWCNGAPLPRPAMAYLAEGTGGQLVRPQVPGDYVSETLVILNLMEKADTILSRVVDLGDGGSTSIVIPMGAGGVSLGVDTEDKDGSDGDDDDDWIWRCLTCLISSPYILPTVAPDATMVQHQLRDPGGNLVGPGAAGFEYIGTSHRDYVEVQAAAGAALQNGLWQLQLSGSGLVQLKVKTTSGLHLAYLGPSWSHAAGQLTRLRVGLLSSDPEWRATSANFRLTSLTGNTVIPLNLHDDGQHGDGAAGDGLYGGVYTPTMAGAWYLEALGQSKDGTLFRRVDPAPIRVVPFRLPDLAPRTAAPGSSELVTFTLTNDNPPPDGLVAQSAAAASIFELEVFSSQGWAISDTVPATVTVDYGGSIDISLEVRVPAGAAHGLVEETSLTAIPLGDIANSRVAIAETAVRYPHTVYLPLLRR